MVENNVKKVRSKARISEPIPAPNPTRKVAILGTTPSRMEGPIEDPEWEVWTIGPGGKDVHRWDRLFEMHMTWPLEFQGYLNDLSKVEPPQKVYSLKPLSEMMISWAVSHGKDQDWLKENIEGSWAANMVIDRDSLFDKHSRMWFSSSISYCIAVAIEERVTDIGCWGIDLESAEEYISQHTGCRHFLDLARLMGVNLHMPPGCGLMRDLNPYPDRCETHLALTLEKKHKWLTGLSAQKEPEYEGLKMQVYRTEGALLKIQEIIANNPELAIKNASSEDVGAGQQELARLNGMLGQYAANINHLKGELSATEYFRRMYVWNMNEPDGNMS